MSSQHKRPLAAFLLVALVCGLVMVRALRAEGVMPYVERGYAFVAGSPDSAGREGARLDRATGPATVTVDRVGPVAVVREARTVSRTVSQTVSEPAPVRPAAVRDVPSVPVQPVSGDQPKQDKPTKPSQPTKDRAGYDKPGKDQPKKHKKHAGKKHHGKKHHGKNHHGKKHHKKHAGKKHHDKKKHSHHKKHGGKNR